MKLIVQFTKAAASGAMLVIGCATLLASGNIYIGAALFTVGLCAICNFTLPLYTGAVGYARTLDDYGRLAVILLGNIAGCALLGLFVSIALPEISADAQALVLRRVYPIHVGLILSFVCGMLMYTAVNTYRTKHNYIGILTCVPVFIIGGFEHSIAYMGFMGLGCAYTAEVLLNVIIFIIGNGLGALALGFIVNMGAEKEK